jgi:hypothetical protein
MGKQRSHVSTFPILFFTAFLLNYSTPLLSFSPFWLLSFHPRTPLYTSLQTWFPLLLSSPHFLLPCPLFFLPGPLFLISSYPFIFSPQHSLPISPSHFLNPLFHVPSPFTLYTLLLPPLTLSFFLNTLPSSAPFLLRIVILLATNKKSQL